MTPQQHDKLVVIAEMVTTANQLLQAAYAAIYGAGMLDALTVDVRQAIARAAIDTATAARELTPLVKEVGRE